MISLDEIAGKLGIPVKDWPGRCYEVAVVASRLIDGATPVYGHYKGPVNDKSIFAPISIIQHGWVLLEDNQVLDPTRWVFEVVEPYIYIGPGDDYDEGGNSLRSQLIGPPIQFDPEDNVINISRDMLSSDAWIVIENVFKLNDLLDDPEYHPGDITIRQLMWLANMNPRFMKGYATEIYKMFDQFNLRGFIPTDNQSLVEREGI